MKQSTLLLTILILLLTSVLSSRNAQCSVIKSELKDASRRGSPIRISGEMRFSDDPSKVTRYSYEVSASASNVSTKSVLLMVIRFEAQGAGGPGVGQTYIADHFFSPSGLESGSTETLDPSPFVFGAPRVNGEPAGENPSASQSVPIATARLEFVQFGDGSTWGSIDFAQDTLSLRESTLRQLNMLLSTYKERGERDFLSALSKLPQEYLQSVKDACADKEGSQCALDFVQRMIDAAIQHETAMNGASTLSQLR